MPDLEFDGERVIPGRTAESLFRESQMRYAFAGRLSNGRVVLDIASGVGLGTDYLRRAGAANCVGLDLSIDAIRYAKTHFTNCTFAVGDAASLCLADESVDLLVSFETIEHLPSPREFMQQCKRVLRPGGVLLCSTPNHEISQWGPGNRFHSGEMSTRELIGLMQEFFVECSLYGQRIVSYPVFVARSLATRVLDTLHLRSLVRSSIRRFKPLPFAGLCAEVEFAEPNGHYSELDVYPYTERWSRRPTYVLALGRKSF